MGKADWCKHYCGMHEKTHCDAGVEYKTLPSIQARKGHDGCPCFSRDGYGCDKAEYMTPEEIEAYREGIARHFERIGLARDAIVSHLGGPWKRGTPGASGTIPCPACKADGATLHYSRAGYNGHIHAKCSTSGCVSWME